MDFLKSVSKLVFLMVAFTVCLSFLLNKLPVDKFMELALMAFTFYFSIKTPGLPDKPKGDTQ